MIFVQTILKVVDNSGAHFSLCIKVLSNSKKGIPGDPVIISIKSLIFNKKITHRKKRKVEKGSVRKAVIVRTSQIIKRNDFYIKGFENGVAIIGNWDLPIANRIYGPVFYETRISKFNKVALLSEGTI